MALCFHVPAEHPQWAVLPIPFVPALPTGPRKTIAQTNITIEEPMEDDIEISENDLEDNAESTQEAFFDRANTLRTYLVSPVHDAAAKGNVNKLSGKCSAVFHWSITVALHCLYQP